MSPTSGLDPARERIDNLLRELATDVGPRNTEGEVNENDPAVDGALLVEWVLVMGWADPQDMEPFVVRLSSGALSSYARDGLLLQALLKMEE